MGPFGSLRGHHSLQTASEVKSDLRFEISDPNYLLIRVHITYNFTHLGTAMVDFDHIWIGGHIDQI